MLKEQKNKKTNIRFRRAIPTANNPEQDFFYYVNKEDEDEALESLGYNPRCESNSSEDDLRVNKFW